MRTRLPRLGRIYLALFLVTLALVAAGSHAVGALSRPPAAPPPQPSSADATYSVTLHPTADASLIELEGPQGAATDLRVYYQGDNETAIP